MKLTKLVIIATVFSITSVAVAMPPLSQAEKDKSAAEALARKGNLAGRTAMEIKKEKEKQAAEQKAAEKEALASDKTFKRKEIQAVGRSGSSLSAGKTQMPATQNNNHEMKILSPETGRQ